MEYRKSGRGGAGNYYSQQDLDKAARQAAISKVRYLTGDLTVHIDDFYQGS